MQYICLHAHGISDLPMGNGLGLQQISALPCMYCRQNPSSKSSLLKIRQPLMRSSRSEIRGNQCAMRFKVLLFSLTNEIHMRQVRLLVTGSTFLGTVMISTTSRAH